MILGASLGKVRDIPGPVRGDIVGRTDCSWRKSGRIRVGRYVILCVVTCVYLEEHVAFQPWLFYLYDDCGVTNHQLNGEGMHIPTCRIKLPVSRPLLIR